MHVNVSFNVKHSYFAYLARAVDSISDVALRRIIPQEDDFKSGIDYQRIPYPKYKMQHVDVYQFHALQKLVLSKSSAPILIPGPFGSGKTRLLAVATEFIIGEGKRVSSAARVLLCCHHQASADVFMDEYFNKMLNDPKHPWSVDVIRVTSETYRQERDHFLTISNFNVSSDRYMTKQFLVVVTTYITSMRLLESLKPGFFTHILIDEGAQSREPECIAPLCLATSATRIVIVGDPQQVRNYITIPFGRMYIMVSCVRLVVHGSEFGGLNQYHVN